jgi:hypothetical protein
MGASAGSSSTAGHVDFKAVSAAALRRFVGRDASAALALGRIGAALFGGR